MRTDSPYGEHLDDTTGEHHHHHHHAHGHGDEVVYRLYARTAYVPLSVDQRVLVYGENKTNANARKKEDLNPKSEEAKEPTSDDESLASVAESVTVLTALTAPDMSIEDGVDDVGTMEVNDILESKQFFESICFDSPRVMMAKYSDKIARFSGDIIKNQ